ncbi:Fumarylacetoacetate hydrolase domain-containing protein 2 [Candida viswanathii]|uniref:Fumarylacetoacetate hydrolase domain-containing protein 2 n=1 Tax=Candida viswanathii TaxID=5486 RepID=A0A367YMD0_9ASCO|nr:Fumarylacetoacetate hydrolase domain-containing protein 2 [Candida viswanathii]
MSWKRLIRFVAQDGKIYRGEPILTGSDYDVGRKFLDGEQIQARVIQGDNIFEDAVVTDQVLDVKKLLGPLAQSDVPIVKCIGLNYSKHIEESGIPKPPYPPLFYKPRTAVADFNEPISIPRIAQEDQCDYEGELCVVIGKTGKNISEEKALDHVAGYVVGNDVSARTWQMHPKFAGGAPQWNFSKSFDKYAPLGPQLVSTSVIPDPSVLHLTTKVNGELRQDTSTGDLLFSVSKIIAFLSQETTLEQGTVIMTGTPSGVCLGMKPPKYLQNGDEVKVAITEIGTLANKMDFQ